MNSKQKTLKDLVECIVNQDYVNAKDHLECAVESTIIDHFKNILVKETK